MWYKNVGTNVFRFVTKHMFDRQMDRKALAIPCVAYMQSYCKNHEFKTLYSQYRTYLPGGGGQAMWEGGWAH